MDDRIVDLGTQPLWLPPGVMMEALRHDRVLDRELDRLGVAIRFHSFLKGADINNALHEDRLEGGVGGDMPTVTACVADQVQVVSLVDLQFTGVVARTRRGIGDLRGGRIGVSFGSGAHYGLLQALAAAGVGPSEVEIVFQDIDTLRPALASGRIAAFSAWEPLPSIAARRGEGQVIHKVMSSGYLYFRKAFYDQHTDVVRLILAAEVRAIGWLGLDDGNMLRAAAWVHQAAGALNGRSYDLSLEETADLVRAGLRPLDGALLPVRDAEVDGRLGRAATFLGALGKLPADLTPSRLGSCFQPAILAEVMADPAAYRLDQVSYWESWAEVDR